MNGRVRRAVVERLRPGQRLGTVPTGAPFVVHMIDSAGIVLFLGAQEAWTRISWACLEGIVPFLSGRGWVKVGSRYETAGEPSTLDGYLKGCIKRATAGWVAAVLEAAGIMDVDRSRPTKVRLRNVS